MSLKFLISLGGETNLYSCVGSKRKIKPLSTAIESVDSDPFKEIEVHCTRTHLEYPTFSLFLATDGR